MLRRVASLMLGAVAFPACLFGTVDSLDSEYGAVRDGGHDVTVRSDAARDAHMSDAQGVDASMMDCGAPPVCEAGCLLESLSGTYQGLFVDDAGIYFTLQSDASASIYVIDKNDGCRTPRSILPDGAGTGTISLISGDDTSLYWIMSVPAGGGAALYKAKKPSRGSVLATPSRIFVEDGGLGPLDVGADYIYLGAYNAAPNGAASNTAFYVLSKMTENVVYKNGTSCGNFGNVEHDACHLVEQLAYDDAGTIYWTEFGEDVPCLLNSWSLATGSICLAPEVVTPDAGTPFAFGVAVESSTVYWLEEQAGRIYSLSDGVFRDVASLTPTGESSTQPLYGHPGYLSVYGPFLYWDERDTDTNTVRYAPTTGADATAELTLTNGALVAPIHVDGTGVYLATPVGIVKHALPAAP